MSPGITAACRRRLLEAPTIAALTETWASLSIWAQGVAAIQNAYEIRRAELSKEPRA